MNTNDTTATFEASSPSHEDANAFIRNTVALESMQVFRRLLLPRCLILAALVGTAGVLWPAPLPWWAASGVCLLAPASVRIIELVYERRLSRLGGTSVKKS
jgi:hypothetical protein